MIQCLLRTLFFSVLLSSWTGTSYANSVTPPCREPVSSCTANVEFPGGKKVSYYRSHALDRAEPGIHRAIIVIHGTLRNAAEYFQWMSEATDRANATSDTLVIAPWFKTADDHPSTNEIYWAQSGWKIGETSLTLPRQSSFDVIDAILGILSDRKRFPDLREVTVTGHSAGGQFTQRYALGSVFTFPAGGPTLQYVSSNASSYTYLNDQRPDFSSQPVTFSHPSGSACDGSYNYYRYGLDGLNLYMKRTPLKTLISRYLSRDVVLLLGEGDTNPNDPELDTTCEAELQGHHRYERGQLYLKHLDQFFPGSHHQLVGVPGTAHEARKVYLSDQARQVIF